MDSMAVKRMWAGPDAVFAFAWVGHICRRCRLSHASHCYARNRYREPLLKFRLDKSARPTIKRTQSPIKGIEIIQVRDLEC